MYVRKLGCTSTVSAHLPFTVSFINPTSRAPTAAIIYLRANLSQKLERTQPLLHAPNTIRFASQQMLVR